MNGTMMQYFEWYLPEDQSLWRQVAEDASHLKALGITAVWLPPAYKGAAGKNDVGYAPYDLYDLGEFDQKNSVATKYGTVSEYCEAISALQDNGIEVYADIVLDHRLGADRTENVYACKENDENRNEQIEPIRPIKAWTQFDFPGRGDTYSDFKWNWTHFAGIDWDEKKEDSAVFQFQGKRWASDVDRENGNFDYLMGADVDLNNREVVEELIRWGRWYLDKTRVNGFRMDAVKHIDFNFFNEWLDAVRRDWDQELFAVGEYWSGDLEDLKRYLETTGRTMCLFDVPLHYHFFDASNSGDGYDMRQLLSNTLTAHDPTRSVTFVDNHDTQPGQSLESWVQPWFKPLAYAFVLLRADGYPCVFYGDYYGISAQNIEPMQALLDKLLCARRESAYGAQRDYFDDFHIIGWVREGDPAEPESGLAVLMTNGDGGSKQMYMGHQFAGKDFYDITGNVEGTVTVNENGDGVFHVAPGSVSVWVQVR